MKVWRDLSHGHSLIIQRKSSVKRILLIGKGAWSRKIKEAIEAQNVAWEVKVISARSFIATTSNSNEINEKFNRFELIWITSTPQNQIVILDQLKQFKKKIILEKPIVTKESEIGVLQEIIHNSQSQIYLSEPWTFSRLWRETKEILLTIDGDLAIQTRRGGILLRPGFPAEIDWGPHDLYLLYDYAHGMGAKNANISLVSRMLKENKIYLKYTMGTLTTVEIESGYFNPRKALWKVYCQNKEILSLDFETSELTDYRHDPVVRNKFVDDNPIITMLDHFVGHGTEIDWNIVLELYRDLVQRQ